MKDFAKSIVCNTKAEAEKTGNSYSWTERRGHQELYDPNVPFGGHVRGFVEKSKNGYIGAKTNGSILISKKEFATEEEAKKFVENKKTGNSSHTKEEAKTKDEYFKILKFYQTQGYKTKAGESNPNGSIKLHKGDDSVEITLVGNQKVGNADPRIASLKAKIQQNKDDIGALKDVHYMAKDMENDLRKRRDNLEKELEEVRKDIEGWREVKDKAEVAWRVAESKKA